MDLRYLFHTVMNWEDFILVSKLHVSIFLPECLWNSGIWITENSSICRLEILPSAIWWIVVFPQSGVSLYFLFKIQYICSSFPVFVSYRLSAITVGLLHTHPGMKSSIIQQLEHIISISSCMHLSCNHKNVLWYLFLCFIHHWALEAIIIYSRHHEYLSLCMTSQGFSLYVLILIWSCHHSGLLWKQNKTKTLHVINHGH